MWVRIYLIPLQQWSLENESDLEDLKDLQEGYNIDTTVPPYSLP